MKRILGGLAVITALCIAATATAGASDTGWGAISIGDNWQYAAIATGYDDWQSATAAANNYCGYTDCGYVLTWHDMCGAAAVSASGHWAWAREYTLAEADEVATNNAGWGAYVVVDGC